MSFRNDSSAAFADPDDQRNNTSANEHFDAVLQARWQRRRLLAGGAASATCAVLGGLSTAACSSDRGRASLDAGDILALDFTATPKSLADAVSVPPGYTATVLYALGDPLVSSLPAYANDGTDGDFEQRSGDCHDGIEYFGLSADGHRPDPGHADRGLLGINHEYQNNLFLHARGPSGLPRPAAEVDKEVAVHGLSVIEVRRAGGTFRMVRDSPYNRRITASTEMRLSGPVQGHPLVKTAYSPEGSRTRGTQNNCGTGFTPWGTLLTCEENWMGYFHRAAGDDAVRGEKSVAALLRYGSRAGAASRYGWESAGSGDLYARWNHSQAGRSADGSDDYRHAANTFGYVVEIDPYDPAAVIRKRTAMGRFAHESARFAAPVAGQPLAFYMGDDSRNEYLYKFVSRAVWDPADASPANRITTGDKYLDEGTLFVAKFNADGSGVWLPLRIDHPAVAGWQAYRFSDQADVLVHARIAADALGATKLDRPEWVAVNPRNNEVYLTLTNNSDRSVDAASGKPAVDAANPRSYARRRGEAGKKGNANGHILRLAEPPGDPGATTFRWDVYLFGAESTADGGQVNLSSLSADNDFSSPDGLWFSRATGLCWIETDDHAYTDVTNCMLLASVPGRVGDGRWQTLSHTRADGSVLKVDTPVGRAPAATQLKRFLVGPRGCEVTGLCETPDGKAIFVNIQHPGEDTPRRALGDPEQYGSQWPANAGYGAGRRPRSATLVITRKDGRRIGR